MQYTNICQNMTTFEKRGMGGVSLSILQSFIPSKMRVNIRKIIIGLTAFLEHRKSKSM